MKCSDITQLIADCYSGDPSKQCSAIFELQELENSDAIPALLHMLNSPEWNIRGLTVETLGQPGYGDSETTGFRLVQMLADPEELVRDEVVNALARLNYVPALSLICSLLENEPDWIVRASAAEALGDLAKAGDVETLNALKIALTDSVGAVRDYAVSSIGILGTSEFLPILKNYSDAEEDARSKAEASIAMYRLGDHEQLKVFLKLINDEDEFLIEVALNIIGDLTNRRVPEHLSLDLPLLKEFLLKVGQLFPLVQKHAKEILDSLEVLESLWGKPCS